MRARSAAIDVDHRLRKGPRRFLRQIVPDAAGNIAVLVFGGKTCGIGARRRMRRPLASPSGIVHWSARCSSRETPRASFPVPRRVSLRLLAMIASCLVAQLFHRRAPTIRTERHGGRRSTRCCWRSCRCRFRRSPVAALHPDASRSMNRLLLRIPLALAPSCGRKMELRYRHCRSASTAEADRLRVHEFLRPTVAQLHRRPGWSQPCWPFAFAWYRHGAALWPAALSVVLIARSSGAAQQDRWHRRRSGCRSFCILFSLIEARRATVLSLLLPMLAGLAVVLLTHVRLPRRYLRSLFGGVNYRMLAFPAWRRSAISISSPITT